MALKNLPGLERKLGQEGIAEKISQLTLSELNSLNLEIYRLKSGQVSPAELLNAYGKSRFVRPSDLDPFTLMNFRNRILEHAREEGFRALELSPLMPFGCCSAIAPVDQNNIVTATRGTEVISDITNALALEASLLRKQGEEDTLQLAACERTVRGQSFDNPKFSAHFQLFAMIIAGRDSGNLGFEKLALMKHLNFYIGFLEKLLEKPEIVIRFTPVADEKGEALRYKRIIPEVMQTFTKYPIEFEKARKNYTYYTDLRAAICLRYEGEEHMIIDGGFTDWTQKLLSNRKERLFTSGMGVEFLIKILNG